MNANMAQRFNYLVLLPRVRDDISYYKRLNFHLFSVSAVKFISSFNSVFTKRQQGVDEVYPSCTGIEFPKLLRGAKTVEFNFVALRLNSMPTAEGSKWASQAVTYYVVICEL